MHNYIKAYMLFRITDAALERAWFNRERAMDLVDRAAVNLDTTINWSERV